MSSPESTVNGLDGDSIRAELQRILASEVFANAPMQSRFLSHLVHLQIAGHTAPPKEYTLGVDVFERGADFDPRVDTLVRVQARRLRKRLARYYADQGRADPIRMMLPKGHYRVEIVAYAAAPEVPESASIPPAPSAAEPDAVADGSPRRESTGPRWRRVAGIGILVLVVVLGAVYWHFGHHQGVAPQIAAPAPVVKVPVARAVPAAPPAPVRLPAAAPIPQRSVAVLPFENLSNDKNNQYFVAGVQDLILTKLADIGDLKVIARTSTEQYRSHPEDLKTIGRQLGVATILEGSVQKQGNQVLINVQLIDAKTDVHIWAQSYQRKLDNVFGVEGEVGEKVAQALNAKLTATQSAQLAAVPTTNPAAYDLFLRANYQARHAEITFDPADYGAAISLYRQAVAKDPTFALAYARLSRMEGSLASMGGGDQGSGKLHKQARSDAARAIQLAPNAVASQLLLAVEDYDKGEVQGAMRHIDTALAARPNDADALIQRGIMQDGQGQADAAIASYRQALVVDPRNANAANQLGFEYQIAGHDREAESWFRRALALNPDSLGARYNLAKVIVFTTGNVDQALQAARGDPPLLKIMRVQLLTLQRKYHAAIALLESIPDTFHGESFAYFPKRLRLARLYRLAGDTTQARALIEQMPPEFHAQLGRVSPIDSVSALQAFAGVELDLGHTAAALSATDLAQQRDTRAKRHPWSMVRTASLYAQAGRPDLAVPLLAKALAMPRVVWEYAPVLLWLDPAWDPIRKDPGFQALLKKYAKYKPAVTYDHAPASTASIH